ncbi:acetylornithine deacetylase [Sphingorhabdus sp. 109]|jgi:acetylornithine deacetylase|uniref:acetylornithine deacetylase n=1 Tax=Sphingorhabdus sp. 109 TaxID=2653173 RepID=UPI0012F41642|nr:acetylornithine deacetylase [Sphingorhabdus sp. 109]VWX60948.1 Acetylornithine deacetylase [Sphingorhabdus sp. 109]
MTSALLPAAREILATLIAFDTTSRNSNLELIGWVEDYLGHHGVSSARVVSADASKANLYASVGPDGKGGVILSGHSDVVPIDGQDWDSDPWTVTERDGLLHGRGTCDMKGFIALALAAVPLFKDCAKPVHLAFSYDEEVGCLGAPAMIEEMAAKLPSPALAIIGEPTMMKVISGHKGITVHEVEVLGHEAHSSLTHLGLSANMVAVELMHDLAELARKLWEEADPASPFIPPHATLTIGRMEGGTAANILARRAHFVFDLRCPPEVDPEAVLAPFKAKVAALDSEMRGAFPEAGVTITRLSNAPPMTPAGSAEAEAFVRRLTGDNSPSGVVSYAAEAGQFQQAGFPTVICGPGSIEQAHQPNEYLAVDQFARGADFMERLAEALV